MENQSRSATSLSTSKSTTTVSSSKKTTSYMIEEKDGKRPWGAGKILGLVGLPLIGLTTLFGTLWGVDHIEDQLVAEAREDLSAAGIETANLDIDFDYRDGEATGVLPAGTTAEAAEASVDDGLLRNFEVAAAPAEAPAAKAPVTPTTAAPTTTTAVPTTTAAVPVAQVETGPVEVAATLADEKIVLGGTVLSEAHRTELVEAAVASVGADNVDDQLTVSFLAAEVDGADARVTDLATALGGLAGATEAEARLTDEGLDIEAKYPQTADGADLTALASSLTATSTSVTLTGGDNVQIVELQARLDAMAGELRETVVFATNSAVLNPAAMATLDGVVEDMAELEEPVLDISGHTDNQGRPESNTELSASRAASVKAYLVSQGIDADRIRSTGAGENDPIDSNETAEGRANNRRVELVALAEF